MGAHAHPLALQVAAIRAECQRTHKRFLDDEFNSRTPGAMDGVSGVGASWRPIGEIHVEPKLGTADASPYDIEQVGRGGRGGGRGWWCYLCVVVGMLIVGYKPRTHE
jgi:hypothetical protein